jgi:hypothetical protein
MPVREAIQLVHDALQEHLQATLEALPHPDGENFPEIAVFMHRYNTEEMTPYGYPAVVVDEGPPEPPNQLRSPAPEPGTREWSDVRIPMKVRYEGSFAAVEPAGRVQAAAVLRAIYQVVRLATGRSLLRVRLVGITETAMTTAYDDIRYTGTMTFIAHIHEEML